MHQWARTNLATLQFTRMESVPASVGNVTAPNYRTTTLIKHALKCINKLQNNQINEMHLGATTNLTTHHKNGKCIITNGNVAAANY